MTSAVQHLRTQLGISSPLDVARDLDVNDDSMSSPSKAFEFVINPDGQLRTFKRFRSSLGQSIRAATRVRSDKRSTSSVSTDPNGLSTTSTAVSKERESLLITEESAKAEINMLPKVTFKLMARDGADVGSSVTGKCHSFERSEPLPAREPGSTNYLTPSLRMASLSSPCLYLHSQPISDGIHTPQVTSQTSDVDILASPRRTQARSSKPQPPSICGLSTTLRPRTSKEIASESDNVPKPQLALTQTPTSPTPLAHGDRVRTRNLNLSAASLFSSVPVNLSTTRNSDLNIDPGHRDLLQQATSILCRELLKPPGYNTTGLGMIELEEVELRLRALARLERIWGKSGNTNANGVSTTSGSAGAGFGVLGAGGASSVGEDRERRLFSEALKDGYVLCQLLNKVRPGSITRVDKREDGVVRTSNVTRFLVACSSTLGLSSNALFLHNDLIEGSFESLARVSRTVLALIEISENPPLDRPRLQGRGPYGQSSGFSSGARPTPNLARSVSPPSPFRDQGRVRTEVPVPEPIPKNGSSPIPTARRRWSPTSGDLPPVHSSTPTIDDGEEVDVDEDGMVRPFGRGRSVGGEGDGGDPNEYESSSGGRGVEGTGSTNKGFV